MAYLTSSQLFREVDQAVENGQLPNLFFFYGDEPYLVAQAVDFVKACGLHGGLPDFNLHQYEARDVNIEHFLDEAQTLPMMAPRRVLILRDIHELNEKSWGFLNLLIERPVDSAVVILTAQQIDLRKKSFKNLIEKAWTVEMKRPFENQVPGWIRQIAKGYGLEIEDDAVALLMKKAGFRLQDLDAELKKLKDYLGQQSHSVSAAIVESVVTHRREESVFEFIDCVVKGDMANSLLQLARLLEQGQSEVGIVSLVARHLRILSAIRGGERMGYTGAKLAQHAQVAPYFLKNYQGQAQKWTQRQIENALLVLAETDRALKSSPFSRVLWLEHMILKLGTITQVSTKVEFKRESFGNQADRHVKH